MYNIPNKTSPRALINASRSPDRGTGRPHRPVPAPALPATQPLPPLPVGVRVDRGAGPVVSTFRAAVTMPAILLLSRLFGRAVFVSPPPPQRGAERVNAQRLLDAPPGAGTARATDFLTTAGGWLVGWDSPGPTCVVAPPDADQPGEVTCTVTGHSLSVVPGVDFAVRQTAHGTAERWTAP